VPQALLPCVRVCERALTYTVCLVKIGIIVLLPKIEKRVEQYLEYLEKNAYRKIADLAFEMYETEKIFRSPPENADWKKISAPCPWGKEWACFWFRTVYSAPSADIPLFLSVTLNADSLAFIDGRPAGAFNAFHNKIRIDADGKEHTLHIEGYSGHYYTGCHPFEGRSVYTGSDKKLCDFPNTFAGGSILERCNAVHSLFYDIRALYETAKTANTNSLRRANILKGLCEALAGISFNANEKELEKQAVRAAQALAPLLAAMNSPSTPAMHLIGHAHLDHAWLWPIAETKRKAARTFANMLRFINEYPEFIFFQSQPCQLEIVKNEYPEIFAGIQEAYKNGNWEPNGGMWVEADCNIPSGESLVRQFLVGKKVNREMLGYEADTLWLPDVFGYSAALPQIMAGCRIRYFVTGKISWNDTTRFPYETFIWRGIDGTGVKAHFLTTGYNGRVTPAEFTEGWNLVQHKEVQSACVKPIGEGDGGGGTLRADLEMARRLGDLEGTPRAAWKTVSSALGEIFREGEFPEWRGELYFELHRGTYTTQSKTKRNNRLLEFALRRTELFCALAALEKKGVYPYKELLDCWKGTLTGQFHDIIPGSSIGRVYAEAEAGSQRMLALLADICCGAQRRLAGLQILEGGASSVFVFNDLSWDRSDTVSIPHADAAALQNTAGAVYPVQHFTDLDGNSRAVSFLKMPSLGWARYAVISGNDNGKSPFTWNNNVLETPFYTIGFDEAGRINSMVDRRQDRELVAPGGAFNAIISAEDIPVYWDAWDIDADWEKRVRQETRLVSTEVAADGPVCFRLRRRYEIGAASSLIQDMVCYSGGPRIDFETKVSWQERRRLLKAQFDTVIDAVQVRCEVQYGHIWRNTHRNLMQDRAKFEICAHKWISLEEEGSGIALLNDCKYGHDVQGGRMRLSLLRSPAAPDPDADRGEHCFTYALLPFTGNFGNSGVIRSAYELNSPAMALCGEGTDNTNASIQSFCSVEGNAVIIESVKWPENETGDTLIVRMYESLGGACRTVLHFSRKLKAAAETDMLEDESRELKVHDRNLDLEFRPFEIKTIRVGF
jgi:alpha-mannosidase